MAEWVAAVFALGAVREAPIFGARGELGEVWRLTTDRGTWAVKRLFAPVEPSTGEDVDFQLAALAAGVPLPRPVRTVTGAAVAVGPDGVGHRLAFYARRWLEGDITSRARDEWRLATQLLDLLTIDRARQLLADHGNRADRERP